MRSASVPPAVSVIIATYNAGPLLAHALDALAAQSLPAHLIEILVVDDGSTDAIGLCRKRPGFMSSSTMRTTTSVQTRCGGLSP